MSNILKMILMLVILCGCAMTSQDLPKLYRKNVSAVVSIHVSMTNEYTGETAIRLNGSGFIINRRKGLIVTAAHVVPNYEICQVELFSGLKISGEIIFVDNWNDIAIVKVDPNNFPRDTPELKFELNAEIGELIFCIGNAGGYKGIVSFGSLSSEVISSSFRDPDKFYLSDLHILGGSSGCPVFNFENKVVGMVVQFHGSYTLMIPASVIDKVLKNGA